MRRAAPLLLALLLASSCGEHLGPGTPAQTPRPKLPEAEGAQILFGDLHTHTHFSLDAWAVNLPVLGGEGAHPPADACDFARYCAALDFWSINDHAEGLTPRHWDETRRAVRDCNAVTDPANPDLVTFLGWEWTQVGTEPANHFGHKNVVLRHVDDARVPPRPISALRPEFRESPIPPAVRFVLPIADFANRAYYFDWVKRFEETNATPLCEPGVDTRELPTDCLEFANEPRTLFEKLAQWGGEALVIPHGTTWGLMTPPASEIGMQLAGGQHDPTRQKLFEIYSGHGSAEEYRPWRADVRDEAGRPVCQEPTPGYLPCCWRAGEIIRERCDDPTSAACEEKAREARRHFAEAGVGGYRTIAGVSAADWLDCGQCRDCPLSVMDHRPAMSAQAALAEGAPTGDGAPGRFRFGFLGSSDTHKARPGNGYKETARSRMTDSMGKMSDLLGGEEEPADASREVVLAELPLQQRRYIERQSSFYVTGGLVAVHAADRTRDGIWEALVERRVYGTSGPRILLSFELLNGPAGPRPMGSEVETGAVPRFRVSASGARKQKPGCPAHAEAALGPARLETLCAGECFHPGDERWRIEAVEVARIRPRVSATEDLAELIDDPWRILPCPPAPDGCRVEFEDPEYPGLGREVVYYVRALQEPTPAIGADPTGCERDAEGRCLSVRLCGDDPDDPDDPDCLSPVAERAWSSPIFLTPGHSPNALE